MTTSPKSDKSPQNQGPQIDQDERDDAPRLDDMDLLEDTSEVSGRPDPVELEAT